MIQKIKRYILVTITALTMLAPGLVMGVASAATCDANGAPVGCTALTSTSITDSICSGSNLGNATSTCTTSGADSLKSLAAKIITIFSYIVGVVAVIMVIFGGFKYITSGGDSNSVSGAKNTLIYAIVGLIIVALAQFLVHFVLNTAKGTGLAG